MKTITLSVILAMLPSIGQCISPNEVHAMVRQFGGIERTLSGISTSVAKSAPRLLDSESELIGSAAMGKTLVHYIRIVNYSKHDIQSPSDLRLDLFNNGSRSTCPAPTASILINYYGAQYKYIFYSRDSEYIFEFILNRSSCNSGRPD